jgi:hypothetical protein
MIRAGLAALLKFYSIFNLMKSISMTNTFSDNEESIILSIFYSTGHLFNVC